MFPNRFFRITAWTLGILALLILTGFLWLRQSPYWGGVTLFAEDYRVVNFRDMDRVFPSRPRYLRVMFAGDQRSRRAMRLTCERQVEPCVLQETLSVDCAIAAA